jgi:hypothetical protein
VVWYSVGGRCKLGEQGNHGFTIIDSESRLGSFVVYTKPFGSKPAGDIVDLVGPFNSEEGWTISKA